MNSLRFSGGRSSSVETCSAETTVPWMTRMSRPASHRKLVVRAHALRRQRGRDDDALVLDLADALGDQLGLDRLAVDLLHLARGGVLGQVRDALELLVGVLVAREDALEVEDREAAELADDAGGRRVTRRRPSPRRAAADRSDSHRASRRCRRRRGPSCAARADRYVVESVCAASLLPATNLNLHLRILGVLADKKTPGATGSWRTGHAPCGRRFGALLEISGGSYVARRRAPRTGAGRRRPRRRVSSQRGAWRPPPGG